MAFISHLRQAIPVNFSLALLKRHRKRIIGTGIIDSVKKLAVFLILFGSGLAAFGISGWGFTLPNFVRSDGLIGWYEWPMNNRIEIVIGVVSLIYGVILRKDSK